MSSPELLFPGIEIPEGWERRDLGEKVRADDRYITTRAGASQISSWDRVETGIGDEITRTFYPVIYKVKELHIPAGWERVTSGNIEEGDNLWCGDRWDLGTHSVGRPVQGRHCVIRKIAIAINRPPDGYVIITDGFVKSGDKVCVGDGSWVLVGSEEVGCKVDNFHKIARQLDADPFKQVGVPKGWTILAAGDMIYQGMKCRKKSDHTDYWKDIPLTFDGSYLGPNNPNLFIREIGKKYRLEKKAAQKEPAQKKEPAPAPAKQQPKEEKREEKMAVNPSQSNGNPGFFASMKESMITNGKQAAFTTLAEKITALVIERLPRRMQVLCNLVPKPIRVFLISSAVYGIADRFDVPGKVEARKFSKYAVDGSMYEAMRFALALLDPIFRAIKEMCPSELKQLVQEAEGDSTPPKTTRKPKATEAD